MPDDRTLEAILAAVADSAGRGDLRGVEALAPAVEAAVAAFMTARPQPADIAAVRASAARAAARLIALRGGLHAARARLAEIGRLGTGEAAYDATGARRLIAPAAPAAPRRP